MRSSNSPHLERAALEAKQLEQLQALFTTTLAGNSFYTEKLRSAGVDRVPQSLANFTEQVPVTTKHELVDDQRHHPPYGSNLAFPVEEYCRFSQTSGTTSTPVRWLDTAASWSWMVDSWVRIFEAAGTTEKDRIFFPFSFGPFLGFWTAFDAASRLGALAIPGGGQRSAARLQIIKDNDVTVVCATPTYAIRLGEAAAEEGIDLSSAKVRAIIVAGEPGGAIPGTRAAIETLWPGARVYDHYGMTEVGPATYECPKRRGMTHVLEAAHLAEIVDPETLNPVEPGDVGELLLTTLGRTGSPVIRYRTRDLVRAVKDTPCECGSHELALDGGILGRADDMVVVRGVNLFPSAVEEVLREDGAVGEFQVEIHTASDLAELRLRIESSNPDVNPNDLESRVEESLHRSFGLRFQVECAESGSLPRFEMKAKRWTRV